jgi:hypothetical protein
MDKDSLMDEDGSGAESDDDKEEERQTNRQVAREREISADTVTTDEQDARPVDLLDNSDDSSDDDAPLEIIAQGTGAEVVVPPVAEESG